MGEITSILSLDTICTNLEILYSVTGDVNSTYNWSVEGGNIILPDWSKDCTILWGDVPGNYTITVQETTEAGCIGQIETLEIVLINPDIIFESQYRLCYNQSVVLLADPLNGVWTGEYINGNTFVGYQPGIYPVSYKINLYGCEYEEFTTVKVDPLYEAPTIYYSKDKLYLCTDPNEQVYSVNDNQSSSFVWTINNQIYSLDPSFYIEWYDTTNTYLIEAYGINELGCQSEVASINIYTEACQSFYAPNTFTPNGDGVNDVFIISGMSVYQPRFTIYNRSGAVIYQSNQLFWTGDSSNGYYAQNGVYNWIVEYRDRFGTNKKDEGSVTLVR
jgi:gliding motility-associated-like protein